ncbi:16135_t:CDS:2 [Cetraspora pellucida]|uniref:16135_t:CDS:1 n=1 Tax=Cetraspora pellucida TaxID=1433469 RepID=A0A9N9N3Y1_9GLOM|nr:16135_t:CDS:2 [Cetraspora pellucida]
MGNTESRNDNVKPVRKRNKSNFSRINHSHVKTNSIYPDCTDSTCSYNIKTVSNLTILGGRPYLDEDFPADWEETDRVQTCHFALKHLHGGNYTAPLSDIIKPERHRMWIWSLVIAQEFPEAYVYGVDIISSFPSDIKPSNCYFKECSVSDGLPFDDDEFDYVFMRHMSLALKNYQWVPLLNEIMRVLKPGGTVEFVEFDLIHVGFQNVNCTRKAVALGKWDKNLGKIGEIWTSNMYQMKKSIKSLITSVMNISDSELDRILNIIYFEEVDKYHSYQDHYIILASKTISDSNN